MKLDAAARTAHADFELRNESAETWRAAEGFAVGLPSVRRRHRHADRGWRAHAAGARCEARRVAAACGCDFALPPEDGRYQVLLSPMRENVCWYYEQGWPFLLVEAVADDGATRVTRVRVATRAALRRGSARCAPSGARSSIRCSPSGAIAA